ncbi:MAG: GMP/IMP nucleotidase [Acidiferrobacterales bacterium]|nr:GMP/IMP nucleotidase [Acidiferrobacterales bacterium]
MPSTPLNWAQIETVFLDMDGTLLDLHFDNHFWTQYVPARYSEKHGMSPQQAFDQIFPHMLTLRGSLEWYDVHYWSDFLGMDVLEMKYDAAERIQPRPGAIDFLQALRRANKRIILATNAHGDTLDIKFKRSGIGSYFDYIATSHQLGVVKEDIQFWQKLSTLLQFDKNRSMFIDDNDHVLDAAHAFGLSHILTIEQPDLNEAPEDKKSKWESADLFAMSQELR